MLSRMTAQRRPGPVYAAPEAKSLGVQQEISLTFSPLPVCSGGSISRFGPGVKILFSAQQPLCRHSRHSGKYQPLIIPSKPHPHFDPADTVPPQECPFPLPPLPPNPPVSAGALSRPPECDLRKYGSFPCIDKFLRPPRSSLKSRIFLDFSICGTYSCVSLQNSAKYFLPRFFNGPSDTKFTVSPLTFPLMEGVS